ncbi:hypothetical protein WJX72_008355 [[Myrmecia] bisecta]|uniref:F-box domain-containing protein n=1 Tax=[Myrmecia] bisecta TaxID=41462 RepID=A0AAW1R8A0_9CHLO
MWVACGGASSRKNAFRTEGHIRIVDARSVIPARGQSGAIASVIPSCAARIEIGLHAPTLSGLPDHLLQDVLARADFKARTGTVPLVCRAWHQLAVLPATWPQVKLDFGRLTQHLDPGKPNIMPSFLQWLSKQADGIQTLVLELPTTGDAYEEDGDTELVDHLLANQFTNQVITASLCMIGLPRQPQLSQLHTLSYCTEFEIGHLQCVLDHLSLLPNLRDLSIHCSDGLPELPPSSFKWSYLSCLQKLTHLKYVHFCDDEPHTIVPPEFCQLPSLRELQIEMISID